MKKMLMDYKNGKISLNKILEEIKKLPYEDLGFAKIDKHRKLRKGFPETVFCKGKTISQILNIIESIVISYNFQFITKDIDKGILWFFGSDLKSNNDILALSKFGSDVIEIIAYSTNPIILILFLSSFKKQIEVQFSKNKIIRSNAKLMKLECAKCGDNLHYFPKMGEPIICIKCSYEQLVW